MFGRLPWLAFERRNRALRFLVFFDIDSKATCQSLPRHLPPKDRLLAPGPVCGELFNGAPRRN